MKTGMIGSLLADRIVSSVERAMRIASRTLVYLLLPMSIVTGCAQVTSSYSAELLICDSGTQCTTGTVEGIYVVTSNPSESTCVMRFTKSDSPGKQVTFSDSLSYIDEKNWQCIFAPHLGQASEYKIVAQVSNGDLSISWLAPSGFVRIYSLRSIPSN